MHLISSRRRIAVALMSTLLMSGVAVTMSGCTSSDDFATVNDVASDLQLDVAGDVISEVRYGKANAVEAGGPSFEALIAPDADFTSVLKGRLEDLGFSSAGLNSWKRPRPYTLVQLGERDGGTQYTPQGEPSIVVPTDGAVVVLISSH